MAKTENSTVDARLNIVTLGVADVEKSKIFYERLGWKASSASQDDVIFFQARGVVLALYPRELLASPHRMCSGEVTAAIFLTSTEIFGKSRGILISN